MQAFELLTDPEGDELTDQFASTSILNGVRVESHSQLQFIVDYTPHADNVGDGTCYAEWELLYTEQNGAPNDRQGNPETLVWRSYTVEKQISAVTDSYTSEFLIKRWRAYADDTDAKDRDPTFSLPLGARRVKLSVREVGADDAYGTFKAQVGRQNV